MPDLYVPLDVNFQDDDKILGVSAGAELVYLRAMALAKRLLSDGFIAKAHMRRLADKIDAEPEALADELVEAGLIAPHAPPSSPLGGGYQIVSWLKHNRSAEEVRESSEHGRLGALIRWHKDGKHAREPAPGCPKCPTDTPPTTPPMLPLDGGGMHSRDRVEAEAETSTPAARKKDETFDAVIEACGLNLDELTGSARGAVNKAVKELKEIGASPEGIRARAKIHLQKWPDATLTATSLAKNYAQLAAKPNGARPAADAMCNIFWCEQPQPCPEHSSGGDG